MFAANSFGIGNNALLDTFYIQIQVGGGSAVSADIPQIAPSNTQAFYTRRNTK